MIELEQTIEETGIRFNVKGEKQEIQFMQDWHAHYGQEHKFWRTSDVPEADHGTVTAMVFLDEDVHEKLSRIDFASLFKLTFAKFELSLPDASTAESELFRKLEMLVDGASNLPENETGLGQDDLKTLKDALGLK